MLTRFSVFSRAQRIHLPRHGLALIIILIAVFTAPSVRARKFEMRSVAGRPELVVQLGHTAPVNEISVSPDSRFLLTASIHEAILWEQSSAREIRRFDAQLLGVALFSPDSQRILLGDISVTGSGLRLLDIATGREIWSQGAIVEAAAFSPDGLRILTSEDGLHRRSNFGEPGKPRQEYIAPVVTWRSAHNGAVLQRLTLAWESPPSEWGRSSWTEQVTFSADARWIVTNIIAPSWQSQPDSPARLWKAETGEQIQVFALVGRLSSVVISPHGQLALMASEDGMAHLWDMRTGRQVRRIGEGAALTSKVVSMSFSPDSRRVMVVTRPDQRTPTITYTAIISEISTQKEISRFAWEAKWVQSAKSYFTPDGKSILTANGGFGFLPGEATAVRQWDVERGVEIRRFDGKAAKVRAVTVSPDGRYILTGNEDHQAYLWDIASGKALPPKEHQASLDCVAFSGDGRWFVTGSDDGTARLWETVSGRNIHDFKHQGRVETLALSRDGGFLLTAGDYEDVYLWSTTSRQLERRFPHKGAIDTVVFSFDERFVLTGAGDASIWQFSGSSESRKKNNTVRRWEIATGREVGVIPFPRMYSSVCSAIVTSPDGRMVFASAETTGPTNNLLWDLERNQELSIGRLYGMLLRAVSPDRRWLMFVDDKNKGTVAEFVAAGSSEPLRLHSRTEPQQGGYSLTLSPNRRFALTEKRDLFTILRNPFNGEELCRLITFRDGTWVVIDSEGRFDTNNLEEIRGLHWIMPDDPLSPLPLEIYLRDYYQPRLLTRILNGEELPKVRDISQINRIQPIIEDIQFKQHEDRPELGSVTVVVAQASETTSRAGAQIDRGVYDVRLYREGQLVAQEPSPQEYPPTGFIRDRESMLKNWRAKTRVVFDASGRRTLTFTISLSHQGTSSNVELSAYAFNNDRVKSLALRRTFPLRIPLKSGQKRAFIVTIGVNETESPASWSLNYAVNDADQIRKVLSDRLAKNGDYEVIPIKLIADYGGGKINQATKANLRAVLKVLADGEVSPQLLRAIPDVDKLRRQAGPDDLVIISISSHGFVEEGAFYLLPYDIGRNRGSSLRTPDFLQRCISSEELAEWLRVIDAGDMVLIVDSCQSAAAVECGEFKPGPMGDPGLGQLAYDKGMQILTASQSNQKAVESRRFKLRERSGLSYLTWALLSGLESGEADQDKNEKDGRITLNEWLNYALKSVPELHRSDPPGALPSKSILKPCPI